TKSAEGPNIPRRLTPTLYLFLDQNVSAMEARSKACSDKRKADFAVRQIDWVTGLQVAELGGKIPPSVGGEKTISQRAVGQLKAGKTARSKRQEFPPFYLRPLPHSLGFQRRFRI
ncbi:hypothetical protein, partial [Methylobacterium isbiliense]|uniref:hypothetical protein n=1 Tax=Methylobacterium isbiliense TaxID=315478 RepID=UPI001EE37124